MRVRNPLTYSLLLNGLFAGNLAFHTLSPSRHSETPPAPVPKSSPATLAQALPEPTPQPFQWSSLESEDYPTYIANLRKIGCPELTLSEIISADLDDLYAQKQAELSAQDLSPYALNHAIESLNQEKLALMRQLLGNSTSSTAIASESVPPSQPTASGPDTTVVPGSSSTSTAALPLIFQPIDNNPTFKLNERQTVLVEKLRQSFIQEIGGPNQSPNDPHYRERWESASETANQRLRSLLGQQFYMAYQRQAALSRAPASSL